MTLDFWTKSQDAEIARLRAEVARLTRERDWARLQLEKWAHEHGVEECIAVAGITGERDALRACVTQLAGALRAEYEVGGLVTEQGRAALAAAGKLLG